MDQTARAVAVTSTDAPASSCMTFLLRLNSRLIAMSNFTSGIFKIGLSAHAAYQSLQRFAFMFHGLLSGP